MSHDLICSWLSLPPGSWPPDHYTLLGLRAGEPDPERIERHVQLRMEKVRVYQLAQPDLVTEAMNRIAQAFDCLRDQEAKRIYDARLIGPKSNPAAKRSAPAAPPAATEPAPAAKPAVETAVVQPTATMTPPAPPASRSWAKPAGTPSKTWPKPAGTPSKTWPKPTDTTAEGDKQTLDDIPLPPTDEAVEPPPLPEEPADPALEAARSGPARRGLGTKKALYQRIARTRQLIRAWVQAGRYLGDVRYRLTQKPEAIDLVRQLTIIRQQLQDFPPLLGQAGQPGYLVIALARQPEIVKTYQSLTAQQRRAYVRDWQAGLTFLAAYRLFLREELSRLRRQSRFGRMGRAVRGFITDYPGLWLLALGVVAANIAFPPLRDYWPIELVLGGVLLASIIFYRDVVRRQSLHRRRRVE